MPAITSIEGLKEYISIHYDPTDNGGCWWDSGNYDDAYQCGKDYAETWMLYTIGRMIGMEIQEPTEVELP